MDEDTMTPDDEAGYAERESSDAHYQGEGEQVPSYDVPMVPAYRLAALQAERDEYLTQRRGLLEQIAAQAEELLHLRADNVDLIGRVERVRTLCGLAAAQTGPQLAQAIMEVV